jgi:TPR repeat protein
VEGIEWLKSAACEGDAEAQFELGRCHDEGRGVEQVPY